MDFKGRIAALRDTGFCNTLIAEGDTRIPLQNTYYLGTDEVPNLTADSDHSVLVLAKQRDEKFVEMFLRLSRETNGRALFNFRLFCPNLDELGDLFKSTKNVLPSLGDAGAHVSQIIDADWATFVLKHWIKEKQVYSLTEGVRRITSDPARVMGLKDRGVLATGKRADVNVFDLDRVTQLQPEIVHNFPGGAPHFTQRARGYRATLINGQINLENDELTGARAGQVLRHAH
jgi:N-acyl-D-aspartate/D-glutamate deacylase